MVFAVKAFAGATRTSARRAILLGIVSSVFFAATFVLNRSMSQAHGHWAWSASLRFYLTPLMLAPVLLARRQWPSLIDSIRTMPGAWITWGIVGFAVFYVPLTIAGALAPAWVVAGSWPVTIVCGLILAKFIYRDSRRNVSWRVWASSSAIVVGVLLLQIEQARAANLKSTIIGLLFVLVSAIAYPLGNRKMMLALERLPSISPFVRQMGMTLGSLPAFFVASGYGYVVAGWPSASQIEQSAIVALCSGVIGTTLYFTATDGVREDAVALAAVEATQATEVPFTLILEAWLLGARWPTQLGIAGLIIIVLGIFWYARMTAHNI